MIASCRKPTSSVQNKQMCTNKRKLSRNAIEQRKGEREERVQRSGSEEQAEMRGVRSR